VHLTRRFEDHDKRMLAQYSPEERAAHYQALWMLYMHADRIWEEPKQNGGPHPVELGGYGAVAGFRDMLDILLNHLHEVRDEAGEQPEDFRARMVVERVE
jgi:hypothetical protein